MNNRRRFLALGLTAALLPIARAPAAAEVRLKFSELYTGNGILGLAYSERTLALQGTRVEMRGFMAPPLKAEASFFVLTRTPVDLCPFCNSDADWPIDIVVVYPAADAEFVRNTVPIEVTGTLEVGGFADPGSGFYSRLRLTNAYFRAIP